MIGIKGAPLALRVQACPCEGEGDRLDLARATNHVRSRLGLNGLNFFTAAVQAGFGPFIAVWLTLNGWTLSAVGLALSVGSRPG
jgi:hypothetical protein